MAGRFWKEAATLIIIGRRSQATKQITGSLVNDADYNLLFLKRSQKSSFMPGTMVFPGGAVDTSDFSLDWLDVFKKCGYSANDLFQQFRNDAPLPAFYANKPPDILLAEIGFRISAIRETFEECGLLLMSHMSNSIKQQIDFKDWRKAVHKDPNKFLSLFMEFGGCPAVWNLHEWSGWLTPVIMKKRYDTAFYITFMDEISHVMADRKEIEDLQILSPKEILEQRQNGDLLLPHPQNYEVSRCLNFERYDKLKEFAVERGTKGLDRWCPFIVQTADGLLSVYPGDDLFQESPDQNEDVKSFSLDSSTEELRNTATHLHRVEIYSTQNATFAINIKPKYGHINPLNYKDIVSKL